MFTFSGKFQHWGVGAKITFFTFVLTSIILAALLTMITITTATLLEERADKNTSNELLRVKTTIEVFNRVVVSEAISFSNVLAASFEGKFSIDAQSIVDVAGTSAPTLKIGDTPLNMDFTIVDRFTGQTRATATVFVASGDDFIRISTSVKKEDGERAVGTMLDRAHAGYALLRGGNSYSGLATLFGKQYITHYDPIKDDDGNVIGVLYVGVDISTDMLLLKDKIKEIKIGETGYFYVLNAAPGKNYGTFLIHPELEGKNLLESKDADGRFFIKEMLDQKNGTLRHLWADADDATPREKTVSYAYFKEWNWVIAGGTYRDEITAEANSLRNRYILFGFVAIVIFSALLFWLVHINVTLPLRRAQQAASTIAGGDLSVNIAVTSKDEIGMLIAAMNGISASLSTVVGEVRRGTDTINNAAGEIASGNLDLSSRTEQQASALEETASSMEELTSTVKQNADNARQASTLAQAASGVAVKGGAAVSQVISTMGAINASSKKIVDIISVIDGIAFQTNILALNAAVEAARAGEQGRGFAVVATEVRNLAQRSSAAAKEIKTLIDDSVAQVSIGTTLVHQAGVTMEEVVSSVSRVSGIIGDISDASDQQTEGIDQINQAIMQMDSVTQQNAALVEEAAAAAQSLQQQAESLSQLVGVFTLADNGAAAPKTGKSIR